MEPPHRVAAGDAAAGLEAAPVTGTLLVRTVQLIKLILGRFPDGGVTTLARVSERLQSRLAVT